MVYRDVVFCEKCERTGEINYLFKTVKCIECMGIGYFTIEHLRQVRAGHSLRRNRKRFWLNITFLSSMFGISVSDWKRIEFGHFSVEYTFDVYEALKRYTDSLEKLPFYTLVRNPKNRRQQHKELLVTYNKLLIDREVKRLKLQAKDYQIVVQETYVERLS